MPTEPPDWHKDKKGKARDDFNAPPVPPEKDEPEPEKAPERDPTEKPVGQRDKDKPKVELHPKYVPRFYYEAERKISQEMGRRPPPPRKHTKEQIAAWAQARHDELHKKHEKMKERQRERHEQEKKEILSKDRQPVPGKDSETLHDATKRHQEEGQELETRIIRDELDLNRAIERSEKDERIHDDEYVKLHDLDHDRGDDHDRTHGDAGDGRTA